MPIDVRCPQCGRELQARDEFAGQKIPCPSCGTPLMIGGDPNFYASPSFAGPAADARTSGTATASMVLGLLSFVFSLLTGIPAIVLGLIAQGSISRSAGRLKGSGLATAGIITGALGTLALPCLIALTLPAVQSAREAARRAQCTNNERQIAIALFNYQDAYGSFPPAYTTDSAGNPLLSWRVLILPYMEQSALYDQFEQDEAWNSPANQTLLASMPPTFHCPSEKGTPQDGMTTYQVLVGPGTIFEQGKATKISEITDGTSNTLLFAESSIPVEWTKPDDVNFVPGQPILLGSPHPGGFNAAMADGSVQFIRKQVASPVVDAMAVKDDGKLPGNVP